MNAPTLHWDCARFEGALADYLEDDLAPAARAAAEAHLAGCAACAALVADLRAIATDAAHLPPLRPERDLWAGIETRLEARVVDLADHAARRAATAAPATPVAPAHRGYHVTRRWLAAAAAALVAVSSGATYWATRGGPAAGGGAVAGQDAARTVAVAPTPDEPPVRSPVGTSDARPVSAGSGDPTGIAPMDDVPDGTPATRSATRPTERRMPITAGRAPGGAPASAPGAGAGAAYDREIAALRAVVRERQADLDPATVDVLERNLAIIDQAIAQSRAALARDPRSPLLGEQLTRALGQKVELLRTVALLPRT